MTNVNHAEASRVSRRQTSPIVWIAATVIGFVGAAAWWVPAYPPDPWASIISWLVWIGAAALGAAAAYMLGARGKTVAWGSGLAALVMAVAWPVILFVLVFIGLIIELLTGF